MSSVGTTRLSFLGRLRDRSNQRGWAEFNDRYRELLYRYARRRGASHLEAEDVAQEVSLSLFKGMNQFQYDSKRGRFRNYLRSSVSHSLSRRWARVAGHEKLLAPETLDTLSDSSEAADTEWEREWQLHKLRTALRAISAEFEPVTLNAFKTHVLAGCGVEDTAEKLGISKSSVYQAKCRVLRRLKEQIETTPED